MCIKRMSKLLLMTCRVTVQHSVHNNIGRSLNTHKEKGHDGNFANE